MCIRDRLITLPGMFFLGSPFKIFDLISFSGDEMEEKYIPFVIKNIRRYGDKRTKALLMKKFPDIKPVDANRAVKQALDIIAKRG